MAADDSKTFSSVIYHPPPENSHSTIYAILMGAALLDEMIRPNDPCAAPAARPIYPSTSTFSQQPS
jgi:hypothetical protein